MVGDQKTPGDEEKVTSTEMSEESPQDNPETDTLLTEGVDGSSTDAKSELAQALLQVDEYRDKAARAQAELQNVRRRAEKDVENAHKYSLENMAKELLPVLDNLERGLEAVPAESSEDAVVKSLKEGIELTLSLFIKALARVKIEQVDPGGEPFNPQFHQAITMVEEASVEPNSVVDVMQKGYTLHGRLLRPAMVVVSKASASTPPKIDEQA